MRYFVCEDRTLPNAVAKLDVKIREQGTQFLSPGGEKPIQTSSEH
jgi:hypothetical protein